MLCFMIRCAQFCNLRYVVPENLTRKSYEVEPRKILVAEAMQHRVAPYNGGGFGSKHAARKRGYKKPRITRQCNFLFGKPALRTNKKRSSAAYGRCGIQRAAHFFFMCEYIQTAPAFGGSNCFC